MLVIDVAVMVVLERKTTGRRVRQLLPYPVIAVSNKARFDPGYKIERCPMNERVDEL